MLGAATSPYARIVRSLPTVRPAPPASSPAVRAVMQGNRGRDTQPEAAVRALLHRQGLRFRKHERPLSGLRCEADIVFRRQRVAVFIDGCFWHGCPEHGRVPTTNTPYWDSKIGRNVARDRRNDEVLANAGWIIIRAWEHEPVEAVAARIAAVVHKRGR